MQIHNWLDAVNSFVRGMPKSFWLVTGLYVFVNIVLVLLETPGANLAQGGEGETKGTAGGLANPSTKEENAGNVNVPGGKAGKSMKAMPKGHGSEKKGAGETADNKKPIIGG